MQQDAFELGLAPVADKAQGYFPGDITIDRAKAAIDQVAYGLMDQPDYAGTEAVRQLTDY